MFKEQLLDYQSEKEYLLIRLLYLENFKLGKNEICTKLNISYPTLKKTIERCNDYFQKFFPYDKLQLITDVHEILFEEDPQIPVDALTKFFFIESDKYILLDLLYRKPSLSRHSLAEKLNISTTTLNLLIVQCNELLQEFDLCIKNGKVEGNVFQYFYFYFLFYWETETTPIYEFYSLKNETLINFIEEEYQQKIGIVEQRKLSLWGILLREKRKLFTCDNIKKIQDSHIPNVENTELFHTFRNFFHKNWKELSSYEVECVAYVTYLFFNSFEILDQKTVDLHSIHINDQRHLLMSKIILLLQDDYNLDGCYKLVHNSLYYFLGKMLFFKGYIYSIDQLTLDYFLEKYISDIEKVTVKKIIDSGVFHSPELNFKIHLYYQYGLYSLVYSLRRFRKNKINIALLLNTSSFLFATFLADLEDSLHNNPSIQVTKYIADETYDLVITNLTINKLLNASYTYMMTNVVNQDEIKRISSVIEKIVLEKRS